MRVISGLYKSRRLVAPEGSEVTRPTGDRVKENLFNILAPEIPEAYVLDLFAGSGALGIEALSRGAKHVVFVENNKAALGCLRKNIENLKISSDLVDIIPKRVEDFLILPSRSVETFDLIFADPPYNMEWFSQGLQQLEDSGYCSKECLLVLERAAKDKHSRELETPAKVQNWSLQDMRKYGKTQLEFWRRNYD